MGVVAQPVSPMPPRKSMQQSVLPCLVAIAQDLPHRHDRDSANYDRSGFRLQLRHNEPEAIITALPDVYRHAAARVVRRRVYEVRAPGSSVRWETRWPCPPLAIEVSR